MIACEKAGRQARLIELDPRYCDVIAMRWQGLSGGTATLDATDQTWEQIASARKPALSVAGR